MKKICYLLLMLVAASCGDDDNLSKDQSDSASSNSLDNDEVVDMSAIPEDLTAKVQEAIDRQSEENVFVIDVRTDEEWSESHASGAMHWGLAEHIEKGEFPPGVDKDAEIYIYCRTGRRAGIAIEIMQDAGYTNLTNIRGLEDWDAAGGPVSVG